MQGDLSLVTSRGGEVHLKRLTPDEKAEFGLSDAAEWQAMLDSRAVKVLSPEESQLARGNTSPADGHWLGPQCWTCVRRQALHCYGHVDLSALAGTAAGSHRTRAEPGESSPTQSPRQALSLGIQCIGALITALAYFGLHDHSN